VGVSDTVTMCCVKVRDCIFGVLSVAWNSIIYDLFLAKMSECEQYIIPMLNDPEHTRTASILKNSVCCETEM